MNRYNAGIAFIKLNVWASVVAGGAGVGDDEGARPEPEPSSQQRVLCTSVANLYILVKRQTGKAVCPRMSGVCPCAT